MKCDDKSGICMMKHRKKRSRMSRGKSKKLFAKTAQYVHPRNVHSYPMRGGIRL